MRRRLSERAQRLLCRIGCLLLVCLIAEARARKTTKEDWTLADGSAKLGSKNGHSGAVIQLCSHLGPSSCTHKARPVSIVAPSSSTTLHPGHKPKLAMPLAAQMTFDTHTEQALGLLEANHNSFFEKGIRSVVYRGEGPFGSLGATEDRMRKAFIEMGNLEMMRHDAVGSAMSFLQSYVTSSDPTPPPSPPRGYLRADTGGSRGKKSDSDGTKKIPLQMAHMSVPIAQLRDSQYVGSLGVGTPPQYVHPIFDTGSTNIWVVSENCTAETCLKVKRYSKHNSSTFVPSTVPVRLDITFGTGKISGSIGTDTFDLGNVLVKDQSFGLVENELNDASSNIFELIDFEGIVGFAFPELSSTGKVPFFDNLLEQGNIGSSEMAFYMVNTQAILSQLEAEARSQQAVAVDAAGKSFVDGTTATEAAAYYERPISAMFVGGVDPLFFEGSIQMLPVIREHYWEVKLDSMYIGDKKFCCDENKDSYIIFDSGTSFNTLPSSEIRKFFRLVPPRKCDDTDPNFLDSFPTIKYTMSGVQVELKPEMYVVRSTDNVCKPAYMQIDVPSEFGHAYIFGVTSFMRHFYTVFRRGMNGDPSMVGFAPARHSKEGVAYLTNLINESPGFGPDWVSKKTAPLNEVSNIDMVQHSVEVRGDGVPQSVQKHWDPAVALELGHAFHMPSEI